MSQISAKEAPHLQQIDLTTLNLQQLSTLKQQLDQELNLFQESLTSLKMAQTKFQNSGECLEKISPDLEGRSILVPLTGSMYVPGKLVDVNNVIIDIGTRYYAQKDIESGKDYFKRKINFVTEQMEKIQVLGLEKSKIRDAVVEVMEIKMQNQTA
ncbi:hypothetical protein Trydic_g1371 [Trypoxylus dichotomus]